MSGRLERIAPGLLMLVRYRRQDFPHDLRAGLSVAAVALPVGVAYAALAGFSPVVGLYASILPLFAYALFGSSRQLVVGPDAATCALVAASVAPLASGRRSRSGGSQTVSSQCSNAAVSGTARQ